MGRSFRVLRARPAVCDGRFQIDELAVEAVEVVALAGEGRALVGDERRQVTVDLASLQTQARHPTRILWPEPEAAQAHDQA